MNKVFEELLDKIPEMMSIDEIAFQIYIDNYRQTLNSYKKFNVLKKLIIGPDCARLVLYHMMDPNQDTALKLRVKSIDYYYYSLKHEHRLAIDYLQNVKNFNYAETIMERLDDFYEDIVIQDERMKFAHRRGIFMNDYKEMFSDRFGDYLKLLNERRKVKLNII